MTAFTDSAARRPRGMVKVYSASNQQGEVIDAWLEFEVNNNNFYSADTFHCTFAASALPANRNAGWFSAQKDMFIELFINNDIGSAQNSGFVSWIYGQVDEIDWNINTNTVSVSGRDLTRVFIDTKTTQKWYKKTSSQIAAQFAIEHGMQIVAGATTTPAGKWYDSDQIHMTEERSEWDILNYLAEKEGYRVWVRGQTLYFMQAYSSGAPYQVTYEPGSQIGGAIANFEQLSLKRTLTVSRGIQVTIHSWNKEKAQGFTANFPTASTGTIQAGKSAAGSGIQVYRKTIPNLSQDQANTAAQNWYAQLVAHEMKFDNLRMPGDNNLDVQTPIEIIGTMTAFDQTYFIDSISRHMSLEDGYSMTISGKNQETNSQATL